MIISGLKLKNYRNYNELNIKLKSGVNVFIGDNAQGKTNILESIYFCSIGKSHRTNKDKELIKWNSDFCEIEVDVERERLNKKIKIQIFKDGKKQINVNSIKIRKNSELMGIVNSIMFSPEDLKIVKESPELRRKYLDIELCKISKKYYYNLVQYNKALLQRNTALKSEKINLDVIDVYDRQLSEFGSQIIINRLRYLDKINLYGKKIHNDITCGKENIEFIYSTNLKNTSSIGESLYTLLKEKRKDDIFRRYTTVGPHRDDFIIKINGNDAKSFASQGQQRTAILTMKFSTIEVIKEVTKEYPILLLDDVLSELDDKRQSYILNSINNIQTIVTCTGIEDINKHIKYNSKVFNVTEGIVKED